MVVNRIENRIKDYLDGDYQLHEVTNFPNRYNINYGKHAYKTKICVFSIDLRNSTKLLFKEGKANSGKVHKAFLNVIAEVINNYRGEIRDFQGDSVLAFWSADKEGINSAVRASLAVNWFFSKKLVEHFKPYNGINFGIGIDFGDIYILKVGITSTDNNNDLVYIGKCVNFAVGIANRLSDPYCIGISKAIYSSLKEDMIFTKKDDQKINMWNNYNFKWKDEDVEIFRTNYRWGI